MNRWCASRSIGAGAIVDLERVWQLGRVWYAGRADESWSPRTPTEAAGVFASLGLTGDFWQLG